MIDSVHCEAQYTVCMYQAGRPTQACKPVSGQSETRGSVPEIESS